MNNPAIQHTAAAAPAIVRLPDCEHGIAVLGWLRAALAAVRARWHGPRAVNRVADESDAFCGLSEHVLRDIGASPQLLADAMARARCDFPADYDRIRY